MWLSWDCTCKFPIREISWFLFKVHHHLFSLVSVCSTASSVELPAAQLPCSQWSHDSWFCWASTVLWQVRQKPVCPLPLFPGKPRSRMCDPLFLCPQGEAPQLYHSLLGEPQGFWGISELPCCLVLSSLQAMRIFLSQSASKTNETEISPLGTLLKSWNIGCLFQFFASPERSLELEVFWSSFHTEPVAGTLMSEDVSFQTFTFVFCSPWSCTLSY